MLGWQCHRGHQCDPVHPIAHVYRITHMKYYQIWDTRMTGYKMHSNACVKTSPHRTLLSWTDLHCFYIVQVNLDLTFRKLELLCLNSKKKQSNIINLNPIPVWMLNGVQLAWQSSHSEKPGAVSHQAKPHVTACFECKLPERCNQP